VSALAPSRELRELSALMANVESRCVTAEALLAVLAGLGLSACQKSTPEVAAETRAVSSGQPAASAAASVGAREIPSAAPSAKAEKEGGCAPGGCAPGQCAGSKKE
jgi:hypothetical protein